MSARPRKSMSTGRGEQFEDMQATIDRLKAIACQATLALMTEGEVHPDWQLLDLSSEVLHRNKLDRRLWNEIEAIHLGGSRTSEARARWDILSDQRHKVSNEARLLSLRAAKLPARTLAGVYAKVLMIHSAKTSATTLASSLAKDLIGNRALRESLWPAAPTP
jgi:hypothetical protein